MRPLPIFRSTVQSPTKLSRRRSSSGGGGPAACVSANTSRSTIRNNDVDLFISRIFLFAARIGATRRLIRGKEKYRNARLAASTDVPCVRPLRHFGNVRGRRCHRCRERSQCCRRNRAVPKASSFDDCKLILADRVAARRNRSRPPDRHCSRKSPSATVLPAKVIYKRAPFHAPFLPNRIRRQNIAATDRWTGSQLWVAQSRASFDRRSRRRAKESESTSAPMQSSLRGR